MNKERLSAFNDAIIAIVMTIMVLEIKPPKGEDWAALILERPYFLAYLVSFFLIATTWYNNHYLFNHAEWFSRGAFWANILWLFLMSFSPVTTGWISEFPNSKAAAYFYLLIYILWELSFNLMVWILIRDNPKQKQELIVMKKRTRNIFELIGLVVVIILINWWPASVLFILGLNIITVIFFSPKVERP
ncbi:TMEM175 family protein [Lactobacillus agrestimuris]|uniref:TMEM175 family protein n=1 Tax=Lactobacillus agrestimuris TaxID=2941328 RepID=UPI0020448152|nr:TMEM175 family protein [Lactobacillus agrestimuris]